MPTRRELEEWARASEILHPEELPRLDEFLELFEEQLTIVAPGINKPPVITRYAARRRAAVLWQLDRLVSNGDVMRKRVRDALTRQLARGEHFAEADLDGRLMKLGFEQIADADRLLEFGRSITVADDPEEDAKVVPMRRTRRAKA